LIKLAQLLGDEIQFGQRQVQEPAIHGMERHASAQRVGQVVRRGAQALIGQRGDHHRIGATVRDGLQHATGTDTQEIRHDNRELEMRFLQQALESVVQLDAVARELIPTTHHRAPESLLGVGHEAQDQFLRHEAFHQAFGIGKILLPSDEATIRLRMREV